MTHSLGPPNVSSSGKTWGDFLRGQPPVIGGVEPTAQTYIYSKMQFKENRRARFYATFIGTVTGKKGAKQGVPTLVRCCTM